MSCRHSMSNQRKKKNVTPVECTAGVHNEPQHNPNDDRGKNPNENTRTIKSYCS